MPRPSNQEVRDAFEEIPAENGDAKCLRVRCRYCNDIRAKNTTRQIQHLMSKCEEYKKSDEYKRSSLHLSNLDTSDTFSEQASTPTILTAKNSSAIWSSKQATTDGQAKSGAPVQRRSSTKRNRDGTNKDLAAPASATPARTPTMVPSLVSRLERQAAPLSTVCQHQFLCSAGAGTLEADLFTQWAAQRAHFFRAYISFVGSLLAKIRIPIAPNVQSHASYRTVLTLQAVLSNVLAAVNLLETNVTHSPEPPTSATKAYIDLLQSCSAPNASLLEGLLVLWATEMCNHTSWRHAMSYRQSYTLFNSQQAAHITVLHQNLMPAWTGDGFIALVDTCRRLVDEYANLQTTGNGREELTRCEASYKQVVWLWPQIWPERAREDDHADGHLTNGRPGPQTNGTHEVDAEGDNDDEMTTARESISAQGHMPYVGSYGMGHHQQQPMNLTR